MADKTTSDLAERVAWGDEPLIVSGEETDEQDDEEPSG